LLQIRKTFQRQIFDVPFLKTLFPALTKSLKEICTKFYSSDLRKDESFSIENIIKEDDVLLLGKNGFEILI